MAGKNNVKLRVRLSEFFDGSIPRDNTFREAVGQAIIDSILERTGEGKDVEGKSFPKYSKEYMKSLDFDAAGKTGHVNLKLTGDMLGQLDITNIDGNTIEIGWDDTEQVNKAHGHITGSVGKKRDFLGLRPSEASEIRGEFNSALKSFRDKNKSSFREKIGAILTQLRDSDGDEG